MKNMKNMKNMENIENILGFTKPIDETKFSLEIEIKKMQASIEKNKRTLAKLEIETKVLTENNKWQKNTLARKLNIPDSEEQEIRSSLEKGEARLVTIEEEADELKKRIVLESKLVTFLQLSVHESRSDIFSNDLNKDLPLS